MLLLKSNKYKELEHTVTADVTKGEVAVINNTFGFYFNDALNGKKVTFVYKADFVEGDKVVDSDEELKEGDKVYYVVGLGKISTQLIGTLGVDSYYIGTCRRDAAGTDTTALFELDGTLAMIPVNPTSS